MKHVRRLGTIRAILSAAVLSTAAARAASPADIGVDAGRGLIVMPGVLRSDTGSGWGCVNLVLFGPGWAYGQQDYMVHDVQRRGLETSQDGQRFTSGEYLGKIECAGANFLVRETLAEAKTDSGQSALRVRYALESQDGGPLRLERAFLQLPVGAGEFAGGRATLDGKTIALGDAYSGKDNLASATETTRPAGFLAKDGTMVAVRGADGKPLRLSLGDGRREHQRLTLDIEFADTRDAPSASVEFLLWGQVPEDGRTGGFNLGLPPPPGVGPQVIRPKDGILVPRAFAAEATADCFGGGEADFADGAGTLRVRLPNAVVSAVRLKPNGWYNLNQYMRLVATFRNTGAAPLRPRMRLESGNETDTAAGAPIAPGQTGRVALDFFKDGLQWQAEGDTDIRYTPNLGQPLNTHRVTGIVFLTDDPGAEFELVSLRAEKVTITPPEWSGKRPPVPGKWRQTLDENFDGTALDPNLWDFGRQENGWSAASVFHPDQLRVHDGKLHIVFEKRRTRENGKEGANERDYVSGYCSTYGRFTQTYGYFEARMRLPSAPGLWPAFWTMPDRGERDADGNESPWWARIDTKFGGMEFDIVEQLSTWGPYRYNIAFHWDGYSEEHKSIGTSNLYILPDAEGFFTAGLLWEPGKATYYANGKPVAEWTSERIANVPAYLILYMVDGGWANEPIDDSWLPDEFVIDWIRAWRREE